MGKSFRLPVQMFLKENQSVDIRWLFTIILFTIKIAMLKYMVLDGISIPQFETQRASCGVQSGWRVSWKCFDCEVCEVEICRYIHDSFGFIDCWLIKRKPKEIVQRGIARKSSAAIEYHQTTGCCQ